MRGQGRKEEEEEEEEEGRQEGQAAAQRAVTGACLCPSEPSLSSELQRAPCRRSSRLQLQGRLSSSTLAQQQEEEEAAEGDSAGEGQQQ